MTEIYQDQYMNDFNADMFFNNGDVTQYREHDPIMRQPVSLKIAESIQTAHLLK